MPLSHKLKSGDQVEVLTSQSQKPRPEWVNFLATAKGKNRLRVALRKDQQPIKEQENSEQTPWQAAGYDSFEDWYYAEMDVIGIGEYPDM